MARHKNTIEDDADKLTPEDRQYHFVGSHFVIGEDEKTILYFDTLREEMRSRNIKISLITSYNTDDVPRRTWSHARVSSKDILYLLHDKGGAPAEELVHLLSEHIDSDLEFKASVAKMRVHLHRLKKEGLIERKYFPRDKRVYYRLTDFGVVTLEYAAGPREMTRGDLGLPNPKADKFSDDVGRAWAAEATKKSQT